ncbi:hypothetical protein [Marinitenerispora sediminis]|uniref:CRISPR-associated protein n=1 Tax=Marinitenerispora sediminis TaxID=1931232 RepID=A0A368T9P5_9ACTN|nr:hypothetical protein [Marinitenerispora sediminis]RCV52453.1 hypothetical protein DEF23_18950 [Marinitenerispora sediminis]RCV54966.1 hypothetical protein DEF28_06850 [Marinitenerispora sediminis]RCV61421.1 hypothetical protein DEF24_04280 [Marinitenerispora sediminis]
MTVHLVTVGLSLRNKLHAWLEKEAAKREHNSPAVPSAPDLKLVPLGDTGVQDFLRAALTPGSPESELLRAAAAEFRVHDWPSNLSAELTTLARHADENAAEPPEKVRAGADDIVVLIASDTPGALRAALWDAVALTDGDLSRIRYLHEPDQGSEEARGQVLIVRVPGMDVGSGEGFRLAMRQLGTLARHLIERLAGPEQDYVFHLTGGYKAAGFYWLGIAEGMLGLARADGGKKREVRSVRAVVIHELSHDFIDIPVRPLSPRMVAVELRPTDKDGVFRLPPHRSRLLEGYAYVEEPEGHWRTTPFGEGLRTLLPSRES